MKPTLVVLAAGMGSRYGGLKQIDPVGPSGEVILDYSVYDATRAGFGKVVFVIRRDIEAEFKSAVGSKYEGKIEVEYAFQQLRDVPGDFEIPEGRTKPWGTAHAVLAARDVVREPFGVINADDFYGRDSFKLLADALSTEENAAGRYFLVGFQLRNTVSEHGSVSRGLCRVDDRGQLAKVEECHGIEPTEGGIRLERNGEVETVDGTQTVSMNMWGFSSEFFSRAKAGFAGFLESLENPLKSEYYIPSLVQDLIDSRQAEVEVLRTVEPWLGVTYPEDKQAVQAGIRALVDDGVYPESLWE